jgi:hypothetical protein
MSKPNFPNLRTNEQLAEMLGVPASRPVQWRMRNVGPEYVKIEGRIYYTLDAVVDFINRNTVKTAA